jgi:DDE superfamily endonuclease
MLTVYFTWQLQRIPVRIFHLYIVVQIISIVFTSFWLLILPYLGSTNDCIVWQTSALYHAIREGELPDKYFIIGDEAFSNTDQMLSPYPGRGLGKWKDSFNFWLSHSRQSIERAFGMLTMRFGIFWRKFRFAYERWSLVIIVCMKLHNLCLNRKVTMPQHRFNEDIELDDRYVVYDNNDEDEDTLLRNRAMGDRRNNITERLESEGRLRPLYASSNSRQ